ncbi:preprotein translocase subunit SecY [Blattabacterium cuenoti]|uniref:preprotein translocase subunit SecY n=1 Tax=Blattabacterium cuenoti TaxID=1653831 RepID=UPI00163CA6A4|nr:preprotein translocase subunit SecY [Blattabacterium cuenoti]
MNNFLITFYNIWNAKELRKKIIITLSFLLIYRFGAYIPIPGINPLGISDFLKNFNSGSKGLMQILSSFTGGAFNRASVLSLGIMPYISASIIIQLMCIVIPYLQRLQKDGESGRKQIGLMTRWLTLGLCLIQAPVYLISLTQQFIPFSYSVLLNTYLINISTFYGKTLFWSIGIIVLTSGTLFTMWLGDKITDKGIGNGVSLIIMSGIVARFPDAISKEILSKVKIGNRGFVILFFEFLLWLLVILFSILIIQAIRKIPVQYVSHYKSFSSSFSNSIQKRHQYIPLKMTAAGVMPIIFSQAIILFPLTFSDYFQNEKIRNFFHLFKDIYGFWYNLAFFLLVIIFTFFYTAITIPVNQMADDLKRNGGHIPKIKPGKETAEYIDHVLSNITIPGSVLLAIIAILPSIAYRSIGITQSFALFYGGTSLLIVVGVILDLIQQVDIYLLNYYYDGLMMMRIKNRNNNKFIYNK